METRRLLCIGASGQRGSSFFCLLIGLGQAGPRNFSHRAVRFGYLTTEQLLSGDGAKRSGN